MTRKAWTARNLATLRRMYPDHTAKEIAARTGHSVSSVYQRAQREGLQKSEAFKNSPASGRMLPGTDRGKSGRFKKGMEPWNKGKPFNPGGRSVETRFKKGEMRGAAQHNYVPIGSLRISKDGYLERKVTDDHPVPARRWVGVHRLVWEAENGPVPRGHAIVFKPGCRTAEESEITVDRLECVSRAELMRRNTLHRYPKEIALAIQARGALTRQINKRLRDEKQD